MLHADGADGLQIRRVVAGKQQEQFLQLESSSGANRSSP